MKNYYFAFDYQHTANLLGLRNMVKNRRKVTYRTFLTHVPFEELKKAFPEFEWRPGVKDTHRLKDDWCVSFYKSTFVRIPCYYVDWAAFEYVFLRRGMNE